MLWRITGDQRGNWHFQRVSVLEHLAKDKESTVLKRMMKQKNVLPCMD